MPVTLPVVGKVSYEPIRFVYGETGNSMPAIFHVGEKASATFKLGAPLTLTGGNGYLLECTFAGADIVYGVAVEPGQNLSSDGVGIEGTTEGTAQNQVNSKVVPFGSRVKDGKAKVLAADAESVFSIALKSGQVFTQAMIGQNYGITKDATTGFWYLDNTVQAGNSQVATVVGVDPSCANTAADGSRVYFRFVSTKRFFV